MWMSVEKLVRMRLLSGLLPLVAAIVGRFSTSTEETIHQCPLESHPCSDTLLKYRRFFLSVDTAVIETIFYPNLSYGTDAFAPVRTSKQWKMDDQNHFQMMLYLQNTRIKNGVCIVRKNCLCLKVEFPYLSKGIQIWRATRPNEVVAPSKRNTFLSF